MERLIPHFLNQPDKVVFWTWKELAWFFSVLFSIWSLNSFLLGLFLGMLSIRLLRALQKHPLGDLTVLGPYWFLNRPLKPFPSATLREFYG